MRLLAVLFVFVGSFAALALLGIGVTTLLGGDAWWGMVLVYPELAGAIILTVLFSRRWKTRPIDRNGNAPT